MGKLFKSINIKSTNLYSLFPSSTIEYAKTLPYEIKREIETCDTLFREVENSLKNRSVRFQLIASKERIGFYHLDDWSDRVFFDIINFKKMGYEPVTNAFKLKAVVFEILINIYERCLKQCTNLKDYHIGTFETNPMKLESERGKKGYELRFKYIPEEPKPLKRL